MLGTGAFCPSLVLQPRSPGASGARSTSQRMVANTQPENRRVEQDPMQHFAFSSRAVSPSNVPRSPSPLALRTKPGAEDSGTVASQTQELRSETAKLEGANPAPGWRRGEGSRSAAPLAEAQRWVTARRQGPRPTRSARSPLIKRLDPGEPPGRAVIR